MKILTNPPDVPVKRTSILFVLAIYLRIRTIVKNYLISSKKVLKIILNT